MGSALAEASAAAREVFEEVDDALGQNLSRLMFEGPGDELTLTENAQPALMAHSMAVFQGAGARRRRFATRLLSLSGRGTRSENIQP